MGERNSRIKNRIAFMLSILLIFTLFIGNSSFVVAADATQATDGPITLISDLRVSEGTHLKKYTKLLSGSNNTVYVVEIDLNNPYVKIAPIYGKEGKIDKQPLTKMADENGAVVAINANFFHLTQRPAPFAMEYVDGELITSQSILNDWMTFAITQDQTALIGSLGFHGVVTTSNGASHPIFNLNKEIHNTHAGPSHENRLNLYNARWNGTTLGNSTALKGVVEVVIVQDIVTDIRVDMPGVIVPDNGYVLMGHGAAANFLLENVKIGDPISISYQVTPDGSNIAQAIGAHALLVDNGVPVPLSPYVDSSVAKSNRARSAIGVSSDGKKVYFIAVEKSSTSKGVNLENFAKIIAELGIFRAANLDGGGSTTLVSRMPGYSNVSLINAIDGGSIRSVPDGIAVYNLAPQGALEGLVLPTSTTTILVGSDTAITLRGYDEHVLPYDVYRHSITWMSTNPNIGVFENGRFIAKSRGTSEIYANVQGITSNRHTIQVIGGQDIASVEVSPSAINVLPNLYQPITITAKTVNGKTFTVSSKNVTWKVEGIDGVMDGMTYQAGSVIGEGKLIGNIDGFTFQVPIYQGALYGIQNYLDSLTSYRFVYYPSQGSGSFTRVDTTSGEPIFRGTAAMKLTYQFNANTFNEQGISMDRVESANGMMADSYLTFSKDALGFGVWVYGDESHYGLRAQITDGSGKIHYVPLVDHIDWRGWKYVEYAFAPELNRPITLNSLYIVDEPDVNYQNRPLSGSIYFDEITVLQPYRASSISEAKTITIDPSNADNDLTMRLKTIDVKIKASDLIGKISKYTIKPVVSDLYPVPLIGFNPYAYGFTFEIHEGDQNHTVPMYITTKNSDFVSLMKWSDHEQQWIKVQGYPTSNGAIIFELPGAGTYMPVKDQIPVSFTDIADHWAKDAIIDMAKIGIVRGTSATEFKPHNSLTRGEFATLMYRVIVDRNSPLAEGLTQSMEWPFVDPIPDWALHGSIAMVNLGVMNGVGENAFAPTNVLTREQLATILLRTVQSLQLSIPESMEEIQVIDGKDVSEWAKEGVAFAIQQQLFPLIDDMFLPQQAVNRGEAAYAIAKIYAWIAQQ